MSCAALVVAVVSSVDDLAAGGAGGRIGADAVRALASRAAANATPSTSTAVRARAGAVHGTLEGALSVGPRGRHKHEKRGGEAG